MSGNTAYPVINCPPLTPDWGAQDVWSSLRMPSGAQSSPCWFSLSILYVGSFLITEPSIVLFLPLLQVLAAPQSSPLKLLLSLQPRSLVWPTTWFGANWEPLCSTPGCLSSRPTRSYRPAASEVGHLNPVRPTLCHCLLWKTLTVAVSHAQIIPVKIIKSFLIKCALLGFIWLYSIFAVTFTCPNRRRTQVIKTATFHSDETISKFWFKRF